MNIKSTNVIDMRTGERLNRNVDTWVDLNNQTNKIAAPPEEDVCEAVKQYRTQKEVEARRREAGWIEAVGLGLLLNLLGIF